MLKGIELSVAEGLYTAWSESRPGVVKSIEQLVNTGQRKRRIMEAVRRASIRSAGSEWAVNDLEQVVDYIIHRRKETA